MVKIRHPTKWPIKSECNDSQKHLKHPWHEPWQNLIFREPQTTHTLNLIRYQTAGVHFVRVQLVPFQIFPSNRLNSVEWNQISCPSNFGSNISKFKILFSHWSGWIVLQTAVTWVMMACLSFFGNGGWQKYLTQSRVGVHWWVRSKCGTKNRSAWKNLLPKIHLGYIVLGPCHERFVVEDEIFLLRLCHWRPRQPSAEMRK